MKYLALLLLFSTSVNANVCSQLFSNEISESSIQETYILDLKNGSSFDPRFKKRFNAVSENTVQPNMSLQNYPMPQMRSTINTILESLVKLQKNIKENPSEYDIYNVIPSYGYNFETTIKKGRKLLLEGKFLSHETLLFIDKSVTLSTILEKSYLEPFVKEHGEALADYANRTKYYIDQAFYAQKHFKDSLRSPLGIYDVFGGKGGEGYSAYSLHPALLRPSIIHNRIFEAREFVEAYADGAFLMSVIPNQFTSFDNSVPNNPRLFTIHDSNHYSMFQRALREDIKKYFKKYKNPQDLYDYTVAYAQRIKLFIKKLMLYGDSLSTKESKEFYEEIFDLIHEKYIMPTPENFIEYARSTKGDPQSKSLKGFA